MLLPTGFNPMRYVDGVVEYLGQYYPSWFSSEEPSEEEFLETDEMLGVVSHAKDFAATQAEFTDFCRARAPEAFSHIAIASPNDIQQKHDYRLGLTGVRGSIARAYQTTTQGMLGPLLGLGAVTAVVGGVLGAIQGFGLSAFHSSPDYVANAITVGPAALVASFGGLATLQTLGKKVEDKVVKAFVDLVDEFELFFYLAGFALVNEAMNASLFVSDMQISPFLGVPVTSAIVPLFIFMGSVFFSGYASLKDIPHHQRVVEHDAQALKVLKESLSSQIAIINFFREHPELTRRFLDSDLCPDEAREELERLLVG